MNTIMRPFESVFDDIPDYKYYPSVDELHEHSYDLQKRYPDMVAVETIGTSQQGRPLVIDKINDRNDPKQPKALYVGSVHANEVVGGLTIQHTEEELCARPELLRELGDCALWAVKTIDPDGYASQRWLNSPVLSPVSYGTGLLRQAAHEQASWGFDKLVKGGNPIPEVAALADVMRVHKPDFYYSVHNASYGSGYFLVTRDYPELNVRLHQTLRDIDLAGKTIVDFPTLSVRGIGRYDVKQLLPHNLVSDIDYAHAQNENCFALVPEVPYFTSEMFSKTETGSHTAGETRSQFKRRLVQARGVLLPIIQKYALDDSVEARTAVDKTSMLSLTREAPLGDIYNGSLISDAQYAKAAALAMYRVSYVGVIGRVAERHGDTENARLVDELIRNQTEEIEADVVWQPVPIRDLVQAQARAGLLAMKHHFDALAESS